MVFKPASAQHISSVYQSIAIEFGNLTFGPWTKISLWLPSKSDHSILGLFLFQSDQNSFLTANDKNWISRLIDFLFYINK